MNPIVKHIYIIASIALLAVMLWRFTEPAQEQNHLQEKIITKETEVIKWKAQKGSIEYRTIFDTLATIDTVYKELIKCDSIVKIDSLIIAGQDTIIAEQKELIDISEKEGKKQKRKLFFTKVVAGAVVLVTILLTAK